MRFFGAPFFWFRLLADLCSAYTPASVSIPLGSVSSVVDVASGACLQIFSSNANSRLAFFPREEVSVFTVRNARVLLIADALSLDFQA